MALINNGDSQTFNYTGDIQTLTTVKKGLYKIEAYGARGGGVNANYCGNGGKAEGYILLDINQTLYIVCGGAGGYSQGGTARGGYNGGGNGYSNNGNARAGAGGGATHVAFVSGLLANIGYTEFVTNKKGVIVAGAGGGGGGWNGTYAAGGHGGGLTGGDGRGKWQNAGKGGTQTSGGSAGQNTGESSGTSGSFGQGGAGGASGSYPNGGAGGGGLYGGGGQGTGDYQFGGGGGGSSWLGGVEEVTYKSVVYSPSTSSNANTSDGYVVITLVDIDYDIELDYDATLGSASFEWNNDSIILSATLNSNAQFKGWYINSSLLSTSNPYSYTPTSDVTIEARFERVWDITDSVSGDGAISYTRGIDRNDVVFTVIPDANRHFVKYTVNGIDYITTPLSLHLTENINVIAYFEENEKFHISVSTTFKYGSIYVSEEDAYVGTNVTLWARPFPDYVFDHWEDGSYDNPRSITVTENVTLVAIYQRLMDTNGIYQYRCFVKDQLDMEAPPKSFMVVDTFNIRTDLLTKSTSSITVMEKPTNVNEGDVVVLYDPKGTFLYNGVINSIEDLTLNCSQMQSYFKGTWIYNIHPSSYLEAELAYLLGEYAQGKIYMSSYVDGLIAERLGGFTIDYVGATSINLPSDLDEDGNENMTIMDMEDFMYECYEKYGIMFIFEVNVSGANYIHIKTPTYEPIKVGNNMFAIQNMTPITEIEETNKLIIFASDKTYRTTYVATTNGIVENPSTTANRFNITNTNVVFSDDDVADLVANNLPSTMFNHKLEFDLVIRNFIYGFDDFKLGGSIDVYYNDDYFNTILTGYEISKNSNTNIASAHFICGKVRTSLTKLLTRKAIL